MVFLTFLDYDVIKERLPGGLVVSRKCSAASVKDN